MRSRANNYHQHFIDHYLQNFHCQNWQCYVLGHFARDVVLGFYWMNWRTHSAFSSLLPQYGQSDSPTKKGGKDLDDLKKEVPLVSPKRTCCVIVNQTPTTISGTDEVLWQMKCLCGSAWVFDVKVWKRYKTRTHYYRLVIPGAKLHTRAHIRPPHGLSVNTLLGTNVSFILDIISPNTAVQKCRAGALCVEYKECWLIEWYSQNSGPNTAGSMRSKQSATWWGQEKQIKKEIHKRLCAGKHWGGDDHD